MSLPSGTTPSGRRSPRVALVTEQIDPGGKRSHVDALLAGLNAIGWEARVFDSSCLTWPERGFIAGPNYLLEAVRPVLGHRWIVPAARRVYGSRLRRWGNAWRPDVWHAQEAITFRSVRSAAGGRPVAITVHGPMHREVASAYGVPLDDPTVLWLREVEREAYRDADAVVSVDRNHAEYVREFGRTERVWVIPNFVDTRRFHPGAPPAVLDPDLQSWCGGRPLVLCPRRLVPKNGVDVALRAAHLLAFRGVAVAWLIAGDGPQRSELLALHRALGLAGSVQFCGGVEPEKMPGLSRRADVVVVPSVPSRGVEEATSISALEAQATGRPVIVSDLGGLREIVAHGLTGLRFPAGDPEALAAEVERVLGDPALGRALGERAWEHVRAEHSHEAGARRYAEVYRELGIDPLPGA